MRTSAQFGSDTGMYLVEVYLDRPEELFLTDEEIARAAWALLAEQQIDSRDVVDLFTRVRNGRGDWVYATREADGKLVPVSW